MVLKVMKDSIDACVYNIKEGNVNWFMSTYLTLVHVAAAVGIWSIPSCTWQTLLFAFLLWPLSGFGITAGVHRLWSHRAYQAKLPFRFVLMLLNSIANQGSIYHWTRDHRVHHKHSETNSDPHNAKRGFFFAHMGWLMLKKHPDVIKAGKDMDFSDLLMDPVVRLQRLLDPWLQLVMCFAFPAFMCQLWGDSLWNGYFVPGALRYVYVFHCTFLVNSAAHFFGDRHYDSNIWPAENPIVSFFAIGEGWHNWHHKYPFDYAASEFGISTQYNPTKMFIDLGASMGQVYKRKRATEAWELLKEKRASQEPKAKAE